MFVNIKKREASLRLTSPLAVKAIVFYTVREGQCVIMITLKGENVNKSCFFHATI